MTPEQRRKNRRLGLALLVAVVLIMAWTFWRGSALL